MMTLDYARFCKNRLEVIFSALTIYFALIKIYFALTIYFALYLHINCFKESIFFLIDILDEPESYGL